MTAVGLLWMRAVEKGKTEKVEAPESYKGSLIFGSISDHDLLIETREANCRLTGGMRVEVEVYQTKATAGLRPGV